MTASAGLEPIRPMCRRGVKAAGVSLVAAMGLLPQAAPAPSAHPIGLRSMDGTPIAADLYEPRLQPAPAVVLVHMLTRTRLDWTPVAERLQDAGFAALSLDLRGHGQSGGGVDAGGDLSFMPISPRSSRPPIRRSDRWRCYPRAPITVACVSRPLCGRSIVPCCSLRGRTIPTRSARPRRSPQPAAGVKA
jgi:pimeloyl-ACP methyl ester carboxylesterase